MTEFSTNKEVEDAVNRYMDLQGRGEYIFQQRSSLTELKSQRRTIQEARQYLQNKTAESKKEEKEWMCFGRTFLKFPHSAAAKLVEQDETIIKDEISEVGQNLKSKIEEMSELSK